MQTQAGTKKSVWVFVAIAAVIGVLIGAIAVVVLWPGESSAKAVTLEPADQPGNDPFTDSVQTDDGAAIEPPAVVAASAVRDDLSSDATTSVLVATGTAPGLYGGSGDLKVCDPQKLVDFLNENQDKAQAFAGVLGITTEGIGDHVASLTPVVLLSDTVVTNHGYDNGKATALTSVLQAGTAVMVDQQGVPRVKCNCGNPLTEPEVVPAADWDTRGDAWEGFDTARVTGVVAGDAVDELTLCDLVTGETYTRPVGWEPTAGTDAPNLDGDWTIELREPFDLTMKEPLTDLPDICMNRFMNGRVMTVRGTRATMKAVPGYGDLEGTVGGVPSGSPEWLNQIQRSTNGAVIELRPVGEDIPLATMIVSTGPDGMSGRMHLDVQDRAPQCEAGVVATRVGARPAPSNPSTTSTTTPTTASTVPPAPAAPTGDRCANATIEAAIESALGFPIIGLAVRGCDGRFAAVSYGDGEQDDARLLEWNGSTWVGGACQKYGDPNDLFAHSPEVPDELWSPCTVD